MSTINEDDIDYVAFTKNTSPDPSKIRRGIELREQRVESAMKRPSIRVETEILAQFQRLAAPEQSAEQAINQALREWLAAKDLKEMIRTELQDAVHQAFIQVGVDFPKAEIH